MKRIVFSLWALLWAVSACTETRGRVAGKDARAQEATPATPEAAGEPLHVLFVGNSYTAANDLPAVVRTLGAATPGGAVEAYAIVVNGASLRTHWETSGAPARIAAGKFDAVVIQGQSVEPIIAPEKFAIHASLFSNAIRDAGARGVWFSTWARRAGDGVYLDSSAYFRDPGQMTRELEHRYGMAAEQHGDTLARVGAAWELARAELPDVPLHVDDGSHPSAAGTLLAACVLLLSLTGREPHVPSPPPLGVPKETAAALCALAPRVRCPEGRDSCKLSRP